MYSNLTELRNDFYKWDYLRKKALQSAMNSINLIFIEIFDKNDCYGECSKILHDKSHTRNAIRAFLDDVDPNIESYDITYVAEEYFNEAIMMYSLLGFENYVQDRECIWCTSVNLNLLVKTVEILEERAYLKKQKRSFLLSNFDNKMYEKNILRIIEEIIIGEDCELSLKQFYTMVQDLV